MERTEIPQHVRDIPGWGVDRDPARRPGVPMEAPPRKADGVHWDAIPRQTARRRVLKRRNLDRLTPVFGTGPAPKALSGLLRRLGYAIPQQMPVHWLTLLLADRVDRVESRVGSLVARPRGLLGLLLAALGGTGAWFLTRRTGERTKRTIAGVR